MYMRPFLLNIFFSKRFIHAKVMHRATSKVISVATTNAKDLRSTLPSLTDHNACRVVGRLIAERSKEADVYALAYEPRKGERIEGHSECQQRVPVLRCKASILQQEMKEQRLPSSSAPQPQEYMHYLNDQGKAVMLALNLKRKTEDDCIFRSLRIEENVTPFSCQ
ncbi:hypothetical protein Cgig2_025282 [Carnegiea gigantea]|uniref:Uncharacterized protein n=1 Tax=Carnegiea gigantea TaxID=171969 RepID=A0A9Q1QF52_9CARY|nr:hypothetical protein Cgig2_025282 [Carnegiea gigantea]